MVAALTAAPLFGQAGGTLPAFRFSLQADPPSAMGIYRPGSSIATHIASGAGAEIFAHRYFYNQGD
jgi:hypothetical protein